MQVTLDIEELLEIIAYSDLNSTSVCTLLRVLPFADTRTGKLPFSTKTECYRALDMNASTGHKVLLELERAGILYNKYDRYYINPQVLVGGDY